MCLQNGKTRMVNHSLTNLIIKLHDSGYTEDFVTKSSGGHLLLMSADHEVVNNFHISLINQFYDSLNFRFIYLHAIETNCGLRGLVLSNDLIFTTCPKYSEIEHLQPVYTEMNMETKISA